MDADTQERIKRWRLALGNDADATFKSLGGAGLDGRYDLMDRALDALYGGESFLDGAGSTKRSAGSGPSAPTVAKWLGDVRSLFPPDAVSVIQADAIERKGLKSILFEPEVLATVEPDLSLAATILALKDMIPEKSRDAARAFMRAIVAEIERRLASDLRSAVRGAMNRARHSPLPDLKALDWKRTISRNLSGWDSKRKRLVPERFHFWERAERGMGWDVILDMDQSGSMGTSVIYGSVMGCILASLPAVNARLVAFDTEVVDLSERYGEDPVEMLFGIQLGGGTDIEKSIRYCEQFIRNPERTIFVLLSDLFEGGNEAGLVRRMEALRESGVKTVCLLALDDSGRPSYDEALARRFAAVGVPSFACPPERLPEFLEGAIKGYDLAALAASITKGAQ